MCRLSICDYTIVVVHVPDWGDSDLACYTYLGMTASKIRMNIIDMHDPCRVDKTPNAVETLLSSKNFVQDNFRISRVELRLYCEQTDEKLGVFSLITSFVETDKGSVEMIYDEGYRGKNPLCRTAKFITSNLGISGLILRSIITLQDSHTSSL